MNEQLVRIIGINPYFIYNFFQAFSFQRNFQSYLDRYQSRISDK